MVKEVQINEEPDETDQEYEMSMALRAAQASEEADIDLLEQRLRRPIGFSKTPLSRDTTHESKKKVRKGNTFNEQQVAKIMLGDGKELKQGAAEEMAASFTRLEHDEFFSKKVGPVFWKNNSFSAAMDLFNDDELLVGCTEALSKMSNGTCSDWRHQYYMQHKYIKMPEGNDTVEETRLHDACRRGDFGDSRALLKGKSYKKMADLGMDRYFPQVQDREGVTPLGRAVQATIELRASAHDFSAQDLDPASGGRLLRPSVKTSRSPVDELSREVVLDVYAATSPTVGSMSSFEGESYNPQDWVVERQRVLHDKLREAEESMELIDYLLESGANPYALDTEHNSLLHYAANTPNDELLKILLTRSLDLDLNQQNLLGLSPMDVALRHGEKCHTAKLLEMHGAKPCPSGFDHDDLLEIKGALQCTKCIGRGTKNLEHLPSDRGVILLPLNICVPIGLEYQRETFSKLLEFSPTHKSYIAGSACIVSLAQPFAQEATTTTMDKPRCVLSLQGLTDQLMLVNNRRLRKGDFARIKEGDTIGFQSPEIDRDGSRTFLEFTLRKPRRQERDMPARADTLTIEKDILIERSAPFPLEKNPKTPKKASDEDPFFLHAPGRLVGDLAHTIAHNVHDVAHNVAGTAASAATAAANVATQVIGSTVNHATQLTQSVKKNASK